jgi:hypothetical protein
MKLLAWDIETSKITVTDDLDSERPLGIACAATIVSDSPLPLSWYEQGYPFGRQMLQYQLCKMVDYLCQPDVTVCTWNGAMFDFRTLYEEVDDMFYKQKVIDICMKSIDPGFTQFCVKGFMCGLDKAAKAMGFPGKTEGMHGSLAPVMWCGMTGEYANWRIGQLKLDGKSDDEANEIMASEFLGMEPGTRDAQDKVLEYVGQDAVTTLQVVTAVCQTWKIRWVTRRGSISEFRMPKPFKTWPTVEESMTLSREDTSWLDRTPKTPQEAMAWAGL